VSERLSDGQAPSVESGTPLLTMTKETEGKMIMTEVRMFPVGFATAAPDWRLWVVGEDGKPEEVALVGWVTLAETVITTDEQGVMLEARKTGLQVIKPGWFRDGKVITTLDWGFRMGPAEFGAGEVIDTNPDAHYYDAWPVGPGDRVPTAEELTDWGADHLHRALSRRF
jgi:hypothetical protein